VVKDGLKMSDDFTNLINKLSKDIVSKSKSSHCVAEELRKLNKKLNTKNLTRWNSILFMVRSVLRLTPEEFQQIKQKMPNSTADEKERRKKFDITNIERQMLNELKQVLELFEWVTDEFQANDVTISRVYPCVVSLRSKLFDSSVEYPYTEDIRAELLTSLNKRFSNIINQDICQISTFLDPHFGPDLFPDDKIPSIKAKLVSLIKQSQSLEVIQSNNRDNEKEIIENPNKKSKLENKRNENYVSYRRESTLISNDCKTIEDEINDFIRVLTDANFTLNSTLHFWKTNEYTFKNLSKLAKKFLGVPASSAAVERMFSIAGHIFSCKRRRMGDTLFAILVFLKLNEQIMKQI